MEAAAAASRVHRGMNLLDLPEPMATKIWQVLFDAVDLSTAGRQALKMVLTAESSCKPVKNALREECHWVNVIERAFSSGLRQLCAYTGLTPRVCFTCIVRSRFYGPATVPIDVEAVSKRWMTDATGRMPDIYMLINDQPAIKGVLSGFTSITASFPVAVDVAPRDKIEIYFVCKNGAAPARIACITWPNDSMALLHTVESSSVPELVSAPPFKIIVQRPRAGAMHFTVNCSLRGGGLKTFVQVLEDYERAHRERGAMGPWNIPINVG